MFFKKSPPSPDEVCPQCQGVKSRSMRVCTTCALQASRAPDAPGPVPAQTAAMRPAFTAAPAESGGAYGRPNPPASGYRSEQGVVVRSQAERDIADFLWRNRILFGYEAEVRGRFPPFYLPEQGIVIDRRDGAYESRKGGFQAAGLQVVPLPTDPTSIDRDLRALIAKFYPGREWK